MTNLTVPSHMMGRVARFKEFQDTHKQCSIFNCQREWLWHMQGMIADVCMCVCERQFCRDHWNEHVCVNLTGGETPTRQAGQKRVRPDL